MAAGLATAINDFYGNDATLINASSTGSTLTIQGNDTGTSFTLDSLSTTNAVAIAQEDTLDVFQVASGDSFTTTVNGFDFTVVAAINASADVNGEVIAAPTGNAGEFTITSLNAGTAFTVTTSTIDGGGAAAQAVNFSTTTANQVAGVDTTQSLTAGGGGDATSIASQISADINGSLTGVSSSASAQSIDTLLASGSLDQDRLYLLSANGTSQQVTQYYAEVQNNVSTVAVGNFVLDDGTNKAGIVVDLTF